MGKYDFDSMGALWADHIYSFLPAIISGPAAPDPDAHKGVSALRYELFDFFLFLAVFSFRNTGIIKHNFKTF